MVLFTGFMDFLVFLSYWLICEFKMTGQLENKALFIPQRFLCLRVFQVV